MHKEELVDSPTTRCRLGYHYGPGHDVTSAVLYQIKNHHGNIDVNDNDDSQSFGTPMKNNFSFSSYG